TQVPRLAAKELARRGWEVTVFHAATAPIPGGAPYELSEGEADGVRLVGVHNRPSAIWDLGRPDRELDDPPITAAFGALLDEAAPDVVHFHNLHNLGAALIDEAAARGLPAYFSTHNYWLICPRAYLLDRSGALCGGPGDRGGDCASCVGGDDVAGHRDRLAGIRARFSRGITACLAVSDAVRSTLLGQGYPAEMVDVVRQGMPTAERIWERLGRDRAPGRLGEELVVGFFGSAYLHKGPQMLVEAAQRTEARVRVQIHGEVPARVAAALRDADRRGVVEVMGPFAASELPELLAGVDAAAMPSLWWDCAPLAAAECLAGRVPLLAPRMGGLAEAIRDEVDGLAFDGGDVAGLAAAIDRLAAEPGLLERLQAGIEAPRAFADYVDDLEACYAGERPGRVPDAPPGEPAVRWVGDHDAPTSLSLINRSVTSRLAAAGMPVQRVDRAGRALDAPLPRAAEVEVRHQWPPDLSPPRAGRLAVIQPWEFGAVPSAWLEPLREHVDELWVPSEHVRAMYVSSGADAERVHVVPNGVDLERFSPAGPAMDLPGPADAVRLLFVGGVIARKGPDALLAAFERAFAGRDDVVLVVKDFGADGLYRGGDREALRARAAGGDLPRVVLLDDELADDELPALYRACDVLVAPYRGEGFCMPVLEAMACGLPAIATEGGPTDEFCPPDAGWRIRSRRALFAQRRVDALETEGVPWMLEPDAAHLAELMLEAVAEAREGVSAR
ncbi:MAG TPA: glycosyltransferase, partial [Solirubrobacteraceae bacterium]|nr:glycosyltransferase [Solirubrobacteraceae bacterium]